VPTKRIAVVVTTISDGSFLGRYVDAIREEHVEGTVALIIIPDRKTPHSIFRRVNRIEANGISIYCPSVNDQERFLARFEPLKNLIPYDSDDRRNIGYLMALERKSDIIVSVDDDNLPRPNSRYFAEHSVVGTTVTGVTAESSDGWFNPCDLLEIEPFRTHPRGYPYHRRGSVGILRRHDSESQVHVNTGLWLGHPDIDAVSCLSAKFVSKDFKGPSLIFGRGTWFPVNSQNTAVSHEAMSAYYFPQVGRTVMNIKMGRFGDMFSGYFVQACAHHLGHGIRVGTPIVDHIRNAHNYLDDLTAELPGIRTLEDITAWLTAVELDGNTYAETYLSLADKLDEFVEKCQGPVWDSATRNYFHFMAYSMRRWIDALDSLA